MLQTKSIGARLATLGACSTIILAGVSLRAEDNVEQKVAALMAKMTLDEKIGQMVQADSGAITNQADVKTYFLGSVLSGGDSDPAAGNYPMQWRKMVEGYQNEALKTRLKIPILYGIDAVHGHHNIDGAVIFPHNIGMGATHDPKLVEAEERVTAEEVAGTGIRWVFAPCVAVAQDERWGRTYESYSEDPVLAATLAAAAVRGFQGAELSDKPACVLACAKHFVGDGGTVGGVDQGNTVCDEATLRQLYLPPYQAAINAGVGSIMVSYSSWNGTKLHSIRHLLTDVLKDEMNFNGILVSDYAAIDQISPDYKYDVKQAINAGLDMIMIPNGPGKKNSYVEFIKDLKDLNESHLVSTDRINDAVRRILRVKFQMGLFESTLTDSALTEEIGSPEHRDVARDCVRESLVLLKNEHHLLPLSKELDHLSVVGKAANDLGMQCGGWTITWQGHAGKVTHGGTTLLTGIRNLISPSTHISYSAAGTNMDNADAIIVVVGEHPYAEGRGDRMDLSLSDEDTKLIAKAAATGKPVVTVLYSGRPLILGSALANSGALVAAWLPGTEGDGVADLLFGLEKFTGKLPRTWPSNNDHVHTGDPAMKPAFPLGFGLSD